MTYSLPNQNGDTLYADGGLVSNFPAEQFRAMGADLYHRYKHVVRFGGRPSESLFDILTGKATKGDNYRQGI